VTSEESRTLRRAEVVRHIEEVGLAERLDWPGKHGREVLACLSDRGLSPPFVVSRRRQPGSGRGIRYHPAAHEWLEELADRVSRHGWARAREPLVIRKSAIMAGGGMAARSDAIWVRIVLDRAVCDLLNLEPDDGEAAADAGERILLWRGEPPDTEARQLGPAFASGRPAGSERVPLRRWGPGLVLCDVGRVPTFLGDDLEEFRARRGAWRDALRECLARPDEAEAVLRCRFDIKGAEPWHVRSEQRAFPVLPPSWEKYLKWRVSLLVFDHRHEPEDVGFGGPLTRVIGTAESGAFVLKSRSGRFASRSVASSGEQR